MNNPTLNYQLIYEEIIPQAAKDALELPTAYADVEENFKRLLVEVADAASQQTTDFVLDPEVMADTASLAAEMGSQLYHFANMIHSQTGENPEFVVDED